MMATVADPVPSIKRLTAEEVFDDIGPAYDQAFADLAPQDASIHWLIEQLADKKPAQVMDVGCGSGRPVCQRLAAAGHDVLGIDISGRMLEAARVNVPAAQFVKADITHYSRPAASLDAVTIYFSMIASITPAEIRQNMANVARWLRPGGVVVFATLPMAFENAPTRWMGRECVASGISADDTVATMTALGLEIVHQATSTFTPRGQAAGLCTAEDEWEETHLFVYARKL